MTGLNAFQMAEVVSRYFENNMIVNLGAGLPGFSAEYEQPGVEVMFHAELGLLGFGPLVKEPTAVDRAVLNASMMPVTTRPGTVFCDLETAFEMIRSGKVDISVMGALEVTGRGDLGNIWMPGRVTGNIGGAIDLAACAKRVIVMMEHVTKTGRPRIVNELSVRLTAKRCVSVIVTDIARIEMADDELWVRECFAGHTFADVQRLTEPILRDGTASDLGGDTLLKKLR